MNTLPLAARAAIAELVCLLITALVVAFRYVGLIDKSMSIIALYFTVSVIFITISALYRMYSLMCCLMLTTAAALVAYRVLT